MIHRTSDMTPKAAADALLWLAEMGADEAIGEAAVGRFQAAAPKAAEAPIPGVRAAMPPLPAAPRPAAPPPRAAPATATSGEAAALAASCATLDELAKALAGFGACSLQRTASNLCFCDGNPAAPVMIVGEAPGREEDIEGKPFVGRSGQLLDRMLAAVDLSRRAPEPEKSVFITNTIFWRPPGNRDPTEAETLMCLPFLKRAIDLQRPKLIVCAGKISAHRLLNTTEGILRLRGKWRNYETAYGSVPLLPTLHPAYLLRQPAQKRLSWRDLIELRQRLDRID